MPWAIPEFERKVHLWHDQDGARIPRSGELFANTLCKMNSTSPDMETTLDPTEVTCKICLKDKRLKDALARITNNSQFGAFAPAKPDIVRVVRVLEYVGPKAAVEQVLKQNAVKGFRDFGVVTIREAMLPFPEVL